MNIVPITLSEKTQNRVLGRSAGVPCEVASGLRSHGFGAEADANGMMKKAVRYCKERRTQSGFKKEERKDGMIVGSDALSDGESACDGSKNSETNATCEIVGSVENADRCDNATESDLWTNFLR